MIAEPNLPGARPFHLQFRYSPARAARLPVGDRILVALFLVLVWGIPYPFLLASEGGAPPIEAALNGSVSTRGVLLILAWAVLGLLIWFRVNQTGRIGFLRVLANPPGLYWLLFLFAQLMSVLFSPGPLLCMFRVYQSVVLTCFLIYWFYYEGGRSASTLIRAYVAFSATNALYDTAMYMVYPDAVMSWNPVDGDRLVGGWLFMRDYSGPGLVVLTFCLASLLYCKENRRIYALGVAIGIVGMALSATRGIVFSAVAVASLAPWLRVRKPLARTLILAGTGIVLLLIFVYSNQLNELLGRNAQSLEGFDGRQDVWASNVGEFFHKGGASVLFGLGFLTGGRSLASVTGNGLGNLHNMYLEALVDVGLFGLITLVASFVMLLPAVKVLRRWQASGLGSNHDRFACRDLAFCWLSLITLLVMGGLGNMLLEDNNAGWMTIIGYLLVVMDFEGPRASIVYRRP